VKILSKEWEKIFASNLSGKELASRKKNSVIKRTQLRNR